MSKSKWAQIIGVILLILMNLFQGKLNLDKSGEIEKLSGLLTVPKDVPAATVNTPDAVQIVYKDRIVEKYVAPEGNVEFDIFKFQQTVSTLDSLLALRAETADSGHTDAAMVVSGSEPALAVSPAAIDAKIDSLKRILSNPQGFGLLTIKTWGLCARPQIGCGWNGSLSPYVGGKFFFWNRLGIVAGVTNSQAGIGVTYRLDQWVKFLRNTEIIGLYGIPFRKDYGGLYAGLAVNL